MRMTVLSATGPGSEQTSVRGRELPNSHHPTHISVSSDQVVSPVPFLGRSKDVIYRQISNIGVEVILNKRK